MDPGPFDLLIVAAAALAAGFVNAVAGGGTLISFPALTAVGITPVSANVTNTVALCPGYLGGAIGQRQDLAGQRARLVRLLPATAAGGLVGGIVLLTTSADVFRVLVPYLILLACGLLAAQERIRAWVVRRSEVADHEPHPSGAGLGAIGAVFVASIYGGYFGAGLGIIVLAVLGAVIDDTFIRVNALKQTVTFTVNTTAAVFFVFSGQVVWSAAAVMAVTSLIGGNVGGRVAARLPAVALRRVVIAVGVVIALVYFTR